MTLCQLEALEDRRMISIRHERFNAALITSALINANRSAESEAVSPFDFLVGYDTDPEDAEKEKLRRSIKHAIALAFAQKTFATPEDAQAEKARMIERMTNEGIEDPEGLIREVFPEL